MINICCQEAEDHRRLPDLHLLHGGVPVPLLLSGWHSPLPIHHPHHHRCHDHHHSFVGWHLPLQRIPLRLHLLRGLLHPRCLSSPSGNPKGNPPCKGDQKCPTKFLTPELQVNPANKSQFASISPERGFADFLFAHVSLLSGWRDLKTLFQVNHFNFLLR